VGDGIAEFFAAPSPGGGVTDPGPRVGRQDPDKLHTGVTGGANDTNPDHGSFSLFVMINTAGTNYHFSVRVESDII
jgi:hypothetical protein